MYPCSGAFIAPFVFLLSAEGYAGCPPDRPVVSDEKCMSTMDAFVSCVRRTAAESQGLSESEKKDLEGKVQGEFDRLVKVKGSAEGVHQVERNVVANYSRSGHNGAEVDIVRTCAKFATPPAHRAPTASPTRQPHGPKHAEAPAQPAKDADPAANKDRAAELLTDRDWLRISTIDGGNADLSWAPDASAALVQGVETAVQKQLPKGAVHRVGEKGCREPGVSVEHPGNGVWLVCVASHPRDERRGPSKREEASSPTPDAGKNQPKVATGTVTAETTKAVARGPAPGKTAFSPPEPDPVLQDYGDRLVCTSKPDCVNFLKRCTDWRGGPDENCKYWYLDCTTAVARGEPFYVEHMGNSFDFRKPGKAEAAAFKRP